MRTFSLSQHSSKSGEPFLDKPVSKLEMEIESVDNQVSNGQVKCWNFVVVFFKSTVTTGRKLRYGKFNNAKGRTLAHITHFSFHF